ncbi:endoribonuclease YbeY-like [Lytechinus pictus]|uniref:endoribonuclease YbeY-like n=1 Tax=Lytechinus pictus TaxID=7653 RepID=UPI00240DE572|nr:endoribonuclease YbeY-like [Lytechinus pictus]
MSIIVRNFQKSVAFNLEKMRTDLKALRRILRAERFDVSVICVEDKDIREMNRIYRATDEPTDVLAFPAHENLKPGRLPDPWSDLADLGDMFLGMQYIERDCAKHNSNIDDVLPVIVTHGLCHLIGYNHKSQEQWKMMYDQELQILEQFKKLTGQDLRPLTGRSDFLQANHIDQQNQSQPTQI